MAGQISLLISEYFICFWSACSPNIDNLQKSDNQVPPKKSASHTHLAPIDPKAIIEGEGGYMRSDKTNKTEYMEPIYPLSGVIKPHMSQLRIICNITHFCLTNAYVTIHALCHLRNVYPLATNPAVFFSQLHLYQSVPVTSLISLCWGRIETAYYRTGSTYWYDRELCRDP